VEVAAKVALFSLAFKSGYYFPFNNDGTDIGASSFGYKFLDQDIGT
jgi:hypothetical protein